MVERFNRFLLAMLSNYVSDYGSAWGYHLPKVLWSTVSVHQIDSEIPLPIEFVIVTPPDRNLPLYNYEMETWLEHQETFERIRKKLDVAGIRNSSSAPILSKGKSILLCIWYSLVMGNTFTVGSRPCM